MKKLMLFTFVLLLLLNQNVLAGDKVYDEYCVPYEALRSWYNIAVSAHNKGDSVTALEFYYALRLVGFGRKSMKDPWPSINKSIEERIEYHEKRLTQSQIVSTSNNQKIMMKKREDEKEKRK